MNGKKLVSIFSDVIREFLINERLLRDFLDNLYRFPEIEGGIDAYTHAFLSLKWGKPLTTAQWLLPMPLLRVRDVLKLTGRSMPLAHYLASKGTLPKHFDQWELKNAHGHIVAEIAATRQTLPADFPLWAHVAANRMTIAGLAALMGTLPEDFSVWDLPCEDANNPSYAMKDCPGYSQDYPGYSLAHLAAMKRHPFSADFMGWHDEVRGSPGLRVIDVARKHNNQAAIASYESWQIRQAIGERPAARSVVRRGGLT